MGFLQGAVSSPTLHLHGYSLHLESAVTKSSAAPKLLLFATCFSASLFCLLFSPVCIAAFKPNYMNRPFSTVDCGRSVVTTACHLLFCLSFFLCRHWHPLCFGFESQRILFLFLHRGGFESCSLCQWNNRPWSTFAKWNNWPFRNNSTFDNRNNWTFEAASSLRWL